MKKFYKLSFIFFFFVFEGRSQTFTMNPYMPGTTCATCIVNNNSPKGGGNQDDNVMNGNGTLNLSYNATACGLNYVLGERKLGKRGSLAGANQPAGISITGLPPCFQVLKAFLYCGGSGNGIAVNATVQNPAATSSVFPMTMIGNHVDKCWGYTGTYNYRADITALITGNGNYNVSGIPTNPPTAGNDMDGASIIIIYADPTQNYTGHMVLADGCMVGIGGTKTNNVGGWNACANSTFAEAFMIVSDLQKVGVANCWMNSGAANFGYPAASQDWWDNIVMSPAPNVTAGQNVATFGLTSGGDCYNIAVEGLYYRTNCNVCSSSGLTVTTATTSTCTAGSATAFATGGNAPYTYTWTPTALNTSVITNVAPGNYTVTVKDATGCFTGTALAVIPASNATMAVNSATICVGNSATLTAIGGNTYTWTPSASLSSANGNPVIATPAATTIYTVTGTNSLNCIGTATAQVVVNPLPNPLPNSNSPICVGANLNLTVGAFTSYTWSGPNGFTSNLQNPTIANVTSANAGNYTVSVTNANGCVNTAVVNVVINPLPVITAGNTGPYCAGATINLSVTAGNSYTWTGPNAYSSNAQNPTIVNSQTVNSGNYSVTVANANGCTSTTVTNVVVNALPTPTANSNSPVCSGQAINFTGLGGTTYTWSGPGGFASNSQNPLIAVASASNAGNYTLSVTNANGCTNSVVTNVIINPLPIIPIANQTVCVGSNFTLTAGGGTAYAWTGPNGFNSALQNPPFTNAVTNMSGNYSVVVTSAQGCTNNAVTSLQVVGLPTVTIAGNNTVCAQNFNNSTNTVNLTASGASTFTWTIPGGYNATPNLNSPVINVTPSVTSIQNIATFSVIGSAGSCTSSAVFTLMVNPNPTITVSSASMCAGNSVTLTANNANTYTWSPATALNTTNGPNVIANPSVTTVYSVIGSSLGCNSQTQNGTASVVPNPTITINPAQPVICLGNNINLSAIGATNYSWTPSTALTTTNTANTTANPTVNTTYTVIGEQSTCTNVAVVTVTVLGLPSVTITPSSPTLCMNNYNGSPNTVILNASGASSYTWGPIIGLSTNTLNGSSVVGTSDGVSAIGSGTVIGANGTCTNVATFTVAAVVNPIIAVSSGSMCEGTSVALTANGASTYTWSPATALNTTNGPNVTANPSVTTVYSVIGSSVGCNSQTQAGTVTVVQNPTVAITPGTPTICFGGNIMLTGNGATNYSWTPNIAISATTGVNVTVNPSSNQTYTLIGEQATCTNVAITEVTVIPLPNITVALNNANICMNDFNGSNNVVGITANGASTYTWVGFNGLASNSNMNGAAISATAVAPATIGTGTVEGSVGTCSNSATFSVIIIPNPVISVSSESMCAGTSTVLVANGAATYAWQGPNLNSSTGSSVIANPANTSIYSVIGTSLNCNSMTTPSTVSVIPNPTVSISPVNPTICAGSSIGLGALGATNYTWSPASTVDNPNSANVFVNPLVTTNYTVIGSQNTCTHSAVRQVIVIPLPNLQAVSSRSVLCSGEQANINANGASSYTWAPGYGLTDVNSNFVVANPTISMVYTLTGNNGLCTTSIEVPITVLQKPVLKLNLSPQRVCKGESALIIASGASHYVWAPSNDSTPTTKNVMSITPETSTNYTIVGVNYSGTVACYMTQEILVDVVPQVTASISNSVEICEGESVKLLAGGSNNYIWAPSTGLSNTLAPNPYAQPIRTTVYTVQVSDGGFCGSNATVMVKVNPRPIVNAGDDLTYNADEPMYIYAKGTGTMKWIEGDGILCNDCPTSQIMPEKSSCYKIFTTNEFGCTAQDEVCVTVTYDYNIYIPNIFTPNFDGLNDVFLVYGTGITELEMTIFDRWGEQLYTTTEREKGWDGTYLDKLCKNDVYVYLVKFTTMDKKKHVRSGHVTLMK